MNSLEGGSVSEPIHSSSWTGPTEERPALRRGAFTHGIGEPAFTSDYDRLLQAERVAAAIPSEVRGVIRLAALLLFLAPVILWAAWGFVRAASGDFLIQDNSHWLLAWGLSTTALAGWQIVSRSRRLIGLRKAVLALALVGALGAGMAYGYAGIHAHANGRGSAPERVFGLYDLRGKWPFQQVVATHQRPDGTNVEGRRAGSPLPYAQICERVQRLDGDYGFSWVRVLERSPGSGSEIMWTIRREDCFSGKPLSSLKG
jgi:hypothetical protein